MVFGIRPARITIGLLIFFSAGFSITSYFLLNTGGEGQNFTRIEVASRLVLVAMAMILGVINLLPDYFGQGDRFGKLADLAFLLPAGILLF